MYAYQHRGLFPSSLSDEKPIEKVAILVAMPEEAAPIIKSLNLSRCDIGLQPELNLVAYRGIAKGKEIFLIVNGIDPNHGVAQVGTDAAVLNCFQVITLLKPDTIISAGTAGGYAARNTIVGDIYIASDNFMFHDRRIPLERYDAYGKGLSPCLDAPAMASFLRLKTGVISTGNSLSVSQTDQEIIDQNNVAAKDMEVAAIANLAQKFKIRVMAIKAITNLAGVNADAPSEFKKNFNLATMNLANIMPKVLDYIIGKTPKELRKPVSIVRNNIRSHL